MNDAPERFVVALKHVVILSPMIATSNGDAQLFFEHNSGTRCDASGERTGREALRAPCM